MRIHYHDGGFSEDDVPCFCDNPHAYARSDASPHNGALVLDEQAEQALREVLVYTMPDEERDYRENGGERHILWFLLLLSNLINDESKTLADFEN